MVGFIIGLIVGALLGIGMIALLSANKDDKS